MPDEQIAQRGRMPRFPRGRVPIRRFPRVPVRARRFPRFVVPPVFIGFPRQRCFFIDRFGRCCDRFGRCCDRFGRCEYIGDRYFPFAGNSPDGWYGVPGAWDMMPDAYEDMLAYDDMADYEYEENI